MINRENSLMRAVIAFSHSFAVCSQWKDLKLSMCAYIEIYNIGSFLIVASNYCHFLSQILASLSIR